MDKIPVVSIIVPVYNRQKFIVETIRSLIDQTYLLWEAIIVDDGSTDNTWEVLEQYTLVDKRIKIYKRHNEPKGAQTCRNEGMSLAQGQYFIFLDSDDSLSPTCVENRLKFMHENQDIDMGIFDGLLFNEKPYDTEISMIKIECKEPVTNFIKFRAPWLIHNVIWRSSSIHNKDLIWDPNIFGYQDIDFHLQAIFKDLKFKFSTSKPDCFWRRHGEDHVGKNLKSVAMIDSHLVLFSKMLNGLKKYNIDKSNLSSIRKFSFYLFMISIKNASLQNGFKIINFLREYSYISYMQKIEMMIYNVLYYFGKKHEITFLRLMAIKFWSKKYTLENSRF